MAIGNGVERANKKTVCPSTREQFFIDNFYFFHFLTFSAHVDGALMAEVRPPSKKGTPVVVKFSIFVVDINSINVEDMDFR